MTACDGTGEAVDLRVVEATRESLQQSVATSQTIRTLHVKRDHATACGSAGTQTTG